MIGFNCQFFSVSFSISKSFNTTLRHRKWIMTKINFFVFLIKFIKWKIYNPSESHFIFILKIEEISKFISKTTKNLIYNFTLIRTKENCVTIFSAGFFFNFRKFIFVQEFNNWAFYFTFSICNISQTARTFTFGNFSEIINLFSTQTCTIFYTNRFHTFSVFKHTKFSFSQNII